ncbi:MULTISPECIES: hypothetical protein [Kocuria]|uniref:Uncharacterized protein n=1 Tax=Kocuria subflava TaxID=1736139 RepID=A0A846TI04_9MICC|nr:MULTISPECIES: hypothetical protein [Kocuria]NKE08798.1 hypothetical protein [Kocuria subflava]
MSLRGAVTVWIPLMLFLSTAGWMAVAGSVPVWFSGTALVVGFALSGDPVVRLILHIARDLEAQRRKTMAIITAGRSTELTAADAAGPGEPVGPPLRGGLVIGVLERLSVMACFVLGFPNGVAIVVAIKGLARYGEFTTGHQREQFLIGTLASLLWAGAGAGLVLVISAT